MKGESVLELMLVLWLPLVIVVAMGARSRGRSAFGYLLLGLLFSPLVSGAALMLIRDAAAVTASGVDPYPVAPYRFHEADRRLLLTLGFVVVFAAGVWAVVSGP